MVVQRKVQIPRSLKGRQTSIVNDRIVTFQFSNKKGERLDHFLVACLPEFSRSRLQRLIKDGYVSINGLTVKKTSQILEADMAVQVAIPSQAPSSLHAEYIPLNIIFENTDLLVIDKPAGMVVHPAAGHESGTLVHAVLGHSPDIEGIGGERRPGVIHRLDKDTSGLILMAKNDRAHRWLQDQFRLRKVEKTYLALVDGKPPTPSGRIEAPIGRHPMHRKQMAIVPPGRGREAISEYKLLERFNNHSMLEVRPQTGRTHQIRLHCAFLGCPIVGDTIYGRRQPSVPINRYFLHAARLTVMLPDNILPRTFEAPLPIELEEILAQLRG